MIVLDSIGQWVYMGVNIYGCMGVGVGAVNFTNTFTSRYEVSVTQCIGIGQVCCIENEIRIGTT